MINGKKVFVQPVKNHKQAFDSIQKIATVQEDDDTTGCLLDYVCFKIYYRMIATDLSKPQELDADPKATQKISFAVNLEWNRDPMRFFILEQAKEAILDFS